MNLFEETKLGSLDVKNHFIRSAAWEESATEDGHITSKLKSIYENLARGGVGTIITSFSRISVQDKALPKMLGIYDDSFIEEYRELAERVHNYHAKLVVQLVFAGSAGNCNKIRDAWGPSPILFEETGITPKVMSIEEIGQVIEAFREAAGRVKASGADGIEIHAAHNYLLSQFLNPHYNKRQDIYGGSLKNRCRIVREVYQAIRSEVGEDFLIMAKVNAYDSETDGMKLEDSIEVCKILDELGIDAIEVSGGNPMRKGVHLGTDYASYFRKEAVKIAEQIDADVILTGGNNYLKLLNRIYDNSRIKFFGLARPLICEPALINKWKNGKSKKAKCVACLQCAAGKCTVQK